MNKQYIILSALAIWLSAGTVSTAATQEDYQNAVAEYSASYDNACGELTSNKTACIQQYKASLMVIKDKVLKEGDLDKVKAVNAQISLVTNSVDNPVFDVSDDMFPDLKSATKQYAAKYSGIDASSAKKTLLLLSNYDKTLEKYQRQLTREENLMKAEEAQGLRKEIASRISDLTSELSTKESSVKTATAKAAEPASSGSNKITLIEAIYGTGRKTLNVTDKVRKFVVNGKLILGQKNIDNCYIGSYKSLLKCSEPSSYEAKTLTIKYRLNGKIITETFEDGKYIEIPAESASEENSVRRTGNDNIRPIREDEQNEAGQNENREQPASKNSAAGFSSRTKKESSSRDTNMSELMKNQSAPKELMERQKRVKEFESSR